MKRLCIIYGKGILFLLCLSFLLLQPNKVRAEEYPVSEDGFVYQADWSDSKAVNIIGYQGAGGAITIPSKIDGKKVRIICGFKENATITEVVISNGIRQIGSEAFINCSGLTKISIPATVDNIENAFTFCGSLTEFIVDKKNKKYYILDGVLMEKYDQGVILTAYPGGLEGEYTIPKAVTSIGEQSFYGAAKITKVTIPGTCKSIYPNAFDSCPMLETVVIAKNGVTSLSWKVFAHCTSLTKVSIPSTLTFICEGAFMGCTQLTTLDIHKANKALKVSNGMICSKKENVSGIVLYELLPNVKLQDGVFTIPKNVYEVQTGAFGEIEGVDTIDFSKCKITEFRPYLFEGFKGSTIIIKKGSKLAESMNNAEYMYGENGTITVKYVK
ncbi:MAG: leucine-rich repeat protein [Lachnospiraceae bacterium]|nr:leucine-rich repeat protein [Lachnospiraceae bacterium]